jgi:hypothetical protein
MVSFSFGRQRDGRGGLKESTAVGHDGTRERIACMVTADRSKIMPFFWRGAMIKINADCVGGNRMETVTAQFVNGQVRFDRPPDWPEGTALRVTSSIPGDIETNNDPESVIDRLDSIRPVWDSEEELKEVEKVIAEQKAFDRANWEKSCLEIERMFP